MEAALKKISRDSPSGEMRPHVEPNVVMSFVMCPFAMSQFPPAVETDFGQDREVPFACAARQVYKTQTRKRATTMSVNKLPMRISETPLHTEIAARLPNQPGKPWHWHL
jgi:hypothetical protein